MTSKSYKICIILILMMISACSSNRGGQGNVAILDASSRPHLEANPHMGDYIAFSEKVTNKMLFSDVAKSWEGKKPRLIVGRLVNNTDNESIRIADIHDRIQEVLLNSGLVRIVDKSATSFDYVVKSEITSTRQYGGKGDQLAHFTLQLKLFDKKGELLGQWSDDLPLAKSSRSLF